MFFVRQMLRAAPIVAVLLAARVSFAQARAEPPFSLTVDGEPSAKRLTAGPSTAKERTWRDAKTGLIASVDVVRHAAFGATEWTLHLRNDGKARSPLISDLWSGDFDVDLESATATPQLFSSEGSHEHPSDFTPRLQTIEAAAPIALATFGGRSSDGVMPYFNVFGGTKGAIVAVGWTGNWKAEISRGAAGKAHVRVGLQKANFRLEPGESVRLPGVLIMPWSGDRQDAHNKFRKLILAEYTPQNKPPLELMPIGTSPYLRIGFNEVTEANLLDFVKRIDKAKLGNDTIWIDAGWNEGGFPEKTGNPECDPTRLPHGLKPVADLAHSLGYRFVQWFEPERVMVKTQLAEQHPDWILEGADFTPEVAYQTSFRLLDLGNEAARAWTLDYLTKNIETTGIDVYRQDFNMYPSFFWNNKEPADRVGIKEIRYIEGEYALLDALLKKFPNLVIDNCASGGRRLDFEMMKRSVPLWRTDCVWGRPDYPRSAQAMMLGISYWLPLHGIGTTAPDLESVASGIAPTFQMALDFYDDKVLEAMKPMLVNVKRVRPILIEDYYPLTEHSLDPNQTIAYQFHDAKTDSGVVFAFGKSIDLKTLKPKAMKAANFVWTDWATPGAEKTTTKAEIASGGLPMMVDAATERHAVVLEYRPVK